MRIATIAIAFVMVSGFAAPGSAEHRDGPNATPYQDLRGLIEEMASHLGAWSSRWRGHFPAPPAVPERPLINFMLRNRQELGLTTPQVTELERLRNEFERVAIRLDADAHIAEMEVADLLRKDPVDLAEVEAKVRESERLRAELRIARIRVIERAKGQLDTAQKSRLQDLLASSEPSWARPERRTMPTPPGRPRSF
jgi:hypothetical protein